MPAGVCQSVRPLQLPAVSLSLRNPAFTKAKRTLRHSSILTARGSDCSIVFSIVAKLFLC